MGEVQQRRGIKVVFLVANTTTSGDQERLEMEHHEAGDIVQCGVKVNTYNDVWLNVKQDQAGLFRCSTIFLPTLETCIWFFLHCICLTWIMA